VVADPDWLTGLFAVLMIAIAVYFAARLVFAGVRHRRIHVEVNVAELVMGLAMAGMLRPSLDVVPIGWWEVVFACFALWFVVQGVRFLGRHGFVGGESSVAYHRAHYPLHVVMSCAMLYMYLAASSPAASGSGQLAMAAPTGTEADFVALPLLFIVLLAALAMWQIDGLNRYRAHAALPVGAGGSLEAAPVSEPSAQPAPLAQWLAPRSESVCLVAMSVAMSFLLVLML
jgi:hypothetical protein